jgi:hypothetical protein
MKNEINNKWGFVASASDNMAPGPTRPPEALQ